MKGTVQLTLVTAAVLAPGACARKPKPVDPSPLPRTEAGAPHPPTDDAAGRARQEAEARRAEAERARAALAALEEMIFFAFDSSELDREARTTLDAKLPPLRTQESIRLTIVGHADERGSVEYNLALGMRRAAAARRYLTGFGLPASRLTIRSAGEEEPLDPGHDETAWARNRRAEFRVQGGMVHTGPG
jgi:peptidoglycan-associated lipoprotein